MDTKKYYCSFSSPAYLFSTNTSKTDVLGCFCKITVRNSKEEICNYEWTKFLLAVVYRSPWDIQTVLKPWKKTEKLREIFTTILGLAEPARPWLYLTAYFSTSRSDRNVKLYTIFTKAFNFCYQILGSVSLLVWNQCAFRQCSNFGHFQQFFLT